MTIGLHSCGTGPVVLHCCSGPQSLKAVRACDVMEPALPQLDKNTSLKQAKSVLEQWPAILITENGKIAVIVTSYDWFKAVK